MKFTNEMLEKAKVAKTAEELLTVAKAEGAELTAEEAEKAFADLHKSGELSDEELDNVSGGSCDGNPSPEGVVDAREKVVFLFEIGQRVEIITLCGTTVTAVITKQNVEYVYDKGYYPVYTVTNLDGNNEREVRQNKIQIQ